MAIFVPSHLEAFIRSISPSHLSPSPDEYCCCFCDSVWYLLTAGVLYSHHKQSNVLRPICRHRNGSLYSVSHFCLEPGQIHLPGKAGSFQIIVLVRGIGSIQVPTLDFYGYVTPSSYTSSDCCTLIARVCINNRYGFTPGTSRGWFY